MSFPTHQRDEQGERAGMADMAFRAGALRVHLDLARFDLMAAYDALRPSESEIKHRVLSRIKAIDRVLVEIDAADAPYRAKATGA